ncbi:MAG: hypothetical protein IPP35_08680 [Elusimicrobia bacterium]|nr:hypothetical protein [Elusimicrobiota bacterium]
MKRNVGALLIKIFILSVPIALLFFIMCWAMWTSGELMSVKDILRNETPATLFGLAYSDPKERYKLNKLIKKNPVIIALGSSRVMQFREIFFKPSFYNAGGCAGRIKNFSQFMAHLPNEMKCTTMIVGLDQNFFNPNWDDFGPDHFLDLLEKERSRGPLLVSSFQKFWFDFMTKGISLSKIANNRWSEAIGLNAIVQSNGFQDDGGYQRGPPANNLIREIPNFAAEPGSDAILKEGSRLAAFKGINVNAINELDRFLAACKMRNIHVIAFFPPFPEDVYDKLLELKPDFTGFFQLPKLVSPHLKTFGFEFYDFTNPRTLGAQNMEFCDSIHGSDTVYLRIVIGMALRGSSINQSIDLNSLAKMLNDSKGGKSVFPLK